MGDGFSAVSVSGATSLKKSDQRDCIPELQTPAGKDAPVVRPRSANKQDAGLNGSKTASQQGRQILTNPAEGVLNGGLDNKDHDLIVAQGDVFVHEYRNRRYLVESVLGQGTFGQVFKCREASMGEVAVKVIKNQPAFCAQALVEIGLLKLLNHKVRDFLKDGKDSPIVSMKDAFQHHGHLCLVFEILGLNLYELIKANEYHGLSMNLLKIILKQILEAMHILKMLKIIHCDLKPENVLLVHEQLPQLKVIDFGSACVETHTAYSYIQSRFYRSPEVILGTPYTGAIDMWSFGCMAAELFLGLPLFPGACEHDLLERILDFFNYPPADMLREGANVKKFFVEDPNAERGIRLRTKEEFEKFTKAPYLKGKSYFATKVLDTVIMDYPGNKDEGHEDERKCFVDFLKKCLRLDPKQRWSPNQALQHPFITGETWTGKFTPPADPVETERDRAIAIQAAARHAMRPPGLVQNSMPATSYQQAVYARHGVFSPEDSQALLSKQGMPNLLSPTGHFFSPPVQQTKYPRMAFPVNIPGQSCLPSSVGTLGSVTMGSYTMSGVQMNGVGSMRGTSMVQSSPSMSVTPRHTFGQQQGRSSLAMMPPLSPLQASVNHSRLGGPHAAAAADPIRMESLEGLQTRMVAAHPQPQPQTHQSSAQRYQQLRGHSLPTQQNSMGLQHSNAMVHPQVMSHLHQQPHQLFVAPWRGPSQDSRTSVASSFYPSPHLPGLQQQQQCLQAPASGYPRSLVDSADYQRSYRAAATLEGQLACSSDTPTRSSGPYRSTLLTEAMKKDFRCASLQQITEFEAMSVASEHGCLMNGTSAYGMASWRDSNGGAAEPRGCHPVANTQYPPPMDAGWHGAYQQQLSWRESSSHVPRSTNGGLEVLSQARHQIPAQQASMPGPGTVNRAYPPTAYPPMADANESWDDPSCYLTDYNECDLVEADGRDLNECNSNGAACGPSSNYPKDGQSWVNYSYQRFPEASYPGAGSTPGEPRLLQQYSANDAPSGFPQNSSAAFRSGPGVSYVHDIR